MIYCTKNFPTNVYFDAIMQKAIKREVNILNNSNNHFNKNLNVQDQKGYMLLAPTGERMFTVLSVLGWLIFLFKFAII